VRNVDGDEKRPKPPGRGKWLIWILILATLPAWFMFATVIHSVDGRLVVPYSTFVADVRENRVTSVSIAGDQITGDLTKPTGTFQTTFPSSIGDPTLLRALEAHRVVIESSSSSPSWLIALIPTVLPWLLLIGLLIAIFSVARSRGGVIGGFGRVKPQRYASEKRPAVTFNDVAGVDQAKTELQEEVDFLRAPQKYRDIGARIPKGILLVGPPGTGKTLLARAVAGEAGVNFLSLNASEFVEMFVGVGASRVRDLFTQAKEAAPAIVFVDELDAVGRRRGAGIGTVNDEREQTLNQLLAELDGFDQRLDVIILAATNRPDVLDPALLRPGRFDRQVLVELPDRRGREGILRIHTRQLRLSGDVGFCTLAGATIGLSGAELANLCNEAALTAARHGSQTVSMADFNEAHDKVRMGAAHASLSDQTERRVVAYHEAGHAVVAWMEPHADPVQKVTIVPHGQALGHTQQVPAQERHNLGFAQLLARLTVALGGRGAEEIVLREATTGAENDLVDATSLARHMVMRWGMGEIGLVAFKHAGEQPFLGYEMSQSRDYSEATAARIDADVARLLDEAYRRVRRTLMSARDRLERLADALLATETVGIEQLQSILGPRGCAESHDASPRAG
jgi:cell division protease FtsH